LHLAASYVENDRQTYRETASPAGRPTGYVTPPGASAIDERKLDHSTIWRMLGWLGSQVAALLVARRLIQGRHSNSTCHRFVGAVAPHKFASRKRKRLLRRSRQLLHLIAEWEELFPEPFFPRFATRSGFG
jgi:hypothetical protein